MFQRLQKEASQQKVPSSRYWEPPETAPITNSKLLSGHARSRHHRRELRDRRMRGNADPPHGREVQRQPGLALRPSQALSVFLIPSSANLPSNLCT